MGRTLRGKFEIGLRCLFLPTNSRNGVDGTPTNAAGLHFARRGEENDGDELRSISRYFLNSHAPATPWLTLNAAAAPTGKDSPFTESAGVNPAQSASIAPFSPQLQEFGAYLMGVLPKFIQQTSVYKDELTLYVAPTAVVPVISFLKNHSNTRYESVMDICGVDYPTRGKRFEVVYHLLSVKHNSRIRVKTYADEVSPVPSITSLYSGADWSVSSFRAPSRPLSQAKGIPFNPKFDD